VNADGGERVAHLLEFERLDDGHYDFHEPRPVFEVATRIDDDPRFPRAMVDRARRRAVRGLPYKGRASGRCGINAMTTMWISLVSESAARLAGWALRH
jgi:hypothetical protein